MKDFIILCTVLICGNAQAPLKGFRPPAVPLVVMDPFMNVWSDSSNAYDTWPVYWSTAHKPITIFLRVDGDNFRVFGPDASYDPQEALLQMLVTIWPTRTIYEFQDPKYRVILYVQFTTPILPERWDISSRPITYITFTLESIDGRLHNVQVYYDNTDEFVANDYDTQEVTWTRFQINSEANLDVMQMGTVSQNLFDISADADAIDWGYNYIAVIHDKSVSTVISYVVSARVQFEADGTLPINDDPDKPRIVNDDICSMVVAWNFTVDNTTTVTKYLAFVYDDIYSIKYFGQQFRPYWRRPSANASIENLLSDAFNDYDNLLDECEQFDIQVIQELEAKGGPEYATLAALAYRQTIAATKLVWNDQLQRPWAFLKSISTNDEDMSTLDAIAAASPLFLYKDPSFLELLLLPILAYANNETGDATYNYPYLWAPHHLGTYPTADILASEQTNMPMEETGNMFLMLAAITRELGIESTSFWYPQYWPLMKSWADYLVTTLPNPGDQISTDNEDPIAQNTNLAIKGILGLGAFSQLCSVVGKGSDNSYYYNLAQSFAEQWVELAQDGDHFKMAFDQSGTWSLKYNLFYDKLLGLGLFPSDIIPRELDYYMSYHLNTYGIPLDSRVTYTKLEWMALIAGMSDDTTKQQDIFDVLYNWANTTSKMTPLTDWYDTVSGAQTGYTARPAVGALFGLMIV